MREVVAPFSDCNSGSERIQTQATDAKRPSKANQPETVMKARCALMRLCLLAALLTALNGGAQPVTQIAGGDNGMGQDASLFLKGDGSLWAMGYNADGELGDGTYNNTNLPEQIVANNVTAIATGGYHSLFIKSDGSLWGMGYNLNGQLGDGTYGNLYTHNSTNLPEQIIASNVIAIAAGSAHSLFIKGDGSLWAMGWNQYGQLGDGTFLTTNAPQQIVASNVTAVAAGQYHSLFIKSDGSLWAMGYDNVGQLGDGNYTQTNRPEQIVASNITAIAAGAYHSIFISNSGSLWAMGLNSSGALGDGTYSIAPYHGHSRPEQIMASNITSISAGYHTLFLKSDGSLWAMGENNYGALGDGIYNWPCLDLVDSVGVTHEPCFS
jgi:alpha-tubulin suppressor-like RCC1 family protein